MPPISLISKHIAQQLTERCIQQEYIFSASRSGGAGGQNVNKVNTKVELRFSIEKSIILTADEKQILLSKLYGKLNAEGEIVVTSTLTRSQLKNKELCSTKLTNLLAKALTPITKRIATKPSKASTEKRLSDKKQRSEIKVERRKWRE